MVVVAKFFKPSPSDTFTCISNPSHVIPFSQVNDDYCDCPDGSDEPGTAACAYLSPLSPPQPHPGYSALSASTNTTFALPGFYCKNKGHVPSYIRFESVNDGKCDYDTCCDGSDEWAGVGGTKCEDKCKEIGKEWKKNEETRQRAIQGALKKRKQLATEAQRLRSELEMKVKDVEIKVQGFENKVREAEENLKDVERREKLRVVRGDATGRGTGKLGMLLNLAKSRVEELRSYLSKTKDQRDAMISRVQELESILTALKEDHNPNFNDEGVKRAVRGWEDYAARDTSDTWSDAENRDLIAIMAEDSSESGVNWSDFDSDDTPESDVSAIYQFTAYLPPSIQSWLDNKLTSFRQLLISNGILPDTSSPTDISDSKAVQGAKSTLSDAQRDLTNSQNDLRRTNEDLTKDFGPDGIFRSLASTCVSKDSGEYTYELCFMSSTKQKSKKGGADTNMGNFAGFDVEDVDDAGGKLGVGRRIVMKYENGQHCWNGPNRSTRVVLACSEKEEVWKISESEKCVYRMEVGTAAVCEAQGQPQQGGGRGGKDEL